MKNQYYAIRATLENGEKFLCWEHENHFYFAGESKGYKKPLPPKLFNTKKEAITAWENIPDTSGNLEQFETVCKAKKIKIVKITLTIQN